MISLVLVACKYVKSAYCLLVKTIKGPFKTRNSLLKIIIMSRIWFIQEKNRFNTRNNLLKITIMSRI